MNISDRKIRWGILGPGRIAHAFAQDLLQVPDAQLYAVASRSMDNAREFASKYRIPKAFDSYEAMAEDPMLDAVYIASPHALHYEHTLLCLNHKKAVLCEKPMALHAAQVNHMIETAISNNTLLMEAVWTAFLPHFIKAMDLLKQGYIGRITGLEADFGFHPAYNPESRVFKKELGGGSLLDIGIYPAFLALSVLGMPEKVEAEAGFFENGTDSDCTFSLIYPNDVRANLHSTFLQQTPTQAVIYGTQGKMVIHTRFHQPTAFHIERNGMVENFEFNVNTTGYNFEAAHFSRLLLEGKTQSHVMSFEVSRQLIQILDTVREKIGLHY